MRSAGWVVLAVLLAPAMVQADAARDLARALRSARVAAVDVRSGGRAPALAAVAALDALEHAAPAGREAERARLEAASVLERLYRVGGDPRDLAAARARLSRA
jgi:hypothetical protein